MIIIIISVKGQRTSHLTAYPWCNQYKSSYETKFVCLLPHLENKPTPATDTMNRCKSFLGTMAAPFLWCSESACASKSANWWLKERHEELEEQEDEQQWRQQEQEEEAEEDENEEEDKEGDEGQGEEKEKRARRNTEERMWVLTLANHAPTWG